MQRFGKKPICTHMVGKLLLKKQWKSAFDAILNPEMGREDARKVKKAFIESYDCHAALKQPQVLSVLFLNLESPLNFSSFEFLEN